MKKQEKIKTLLRELSGKGSYSKKFVKKIIQFYKNLVFSIAQNKVVTLFKTEGLDAAEKWAHEKINDPVKLANTLTALAKLARTLDPKATLRLATHAVALCPKSFRKKWLSFLLFDAGKIQEANALLQEIPLSMQMTTSEKNKILMIEGCTRLYTTNIELPPVQHEYAYTPVSKLLLYIAASAQPFHNTGYTIRTHNILKGLAATSWETLCITRPGYPDDRKDNLVKKSLQKYNIENVYYEALEGPHRYEHSPDEYIQQSSIILENKIRALRPAIIQAASDYENALPALIAARRLGVPFIYEVRGLWEYTKASKIPDYEHSEGFLLRKKLETLVAKHADQVFTLGQTLANELINRGVEPSKISLTPNAVDLNLLKPLVKDKTFAKTLFIGDQAFVIGYAGSVVGYEGLDDLVTALHLLQNKIPHAHLIIIGAGDALSSLKQQVKKLKLEKHVHFTGHLPHTELLRYYTLFDMIALPRKPYQVCQLVTPLKPLEAMGLGIPLVVSDVTALKEMVQPNETALVHRANDPHSLADAILQLALDPMLRQKLATQAQQFVNEKHTWGKVCENMTTHYSRLFFKQEEKSYV